MKAAHIPKIERRLKVARMVLTPLLTQMDRASERDIIELLGTDVPELIDAVREAQGAQRKYCRYCGERRLGLLVASPDDRHVWECRDEDGCEARQDRRG